MVRGKVCDLVKETAFGACPGRCRPVTGQGAPLVNPCRGDPVLSPGTAT
jgi:hypothetical protein